MNKLKALLIVLFLAVAPCNAQGYAGPGGTGNLSFGGSGSDGAVSASGVLATRVYNATTFTLSASTTCPSCIIGTSGVLALGTSLTLRSGIPAATKTFTGAGAAGGYGATAATSAGTTGYGWAPGEPGNNTGLIGAGGGAGAAGGGGNGGGATVISATGQGGLNSSGSSSYGNVLNGSGGGGGGSGAAGTGGDGGAGASHLTIFTVGGVTLTTAGTIAAQGGGGGAGGTLGSGGGGGGGGTIEFFNMNTGNLPALTFTVTGGAGGASAGAAANPGGGGGGYIYCVTGGTTGSATFTVTGGAAGTGGGGTAGASGQNGTSNQLASTPATFPNFSFNHMNDNAAGKNMCRILLARKMIHGEDYESEKAHTFVWDGLKGEHNQPLSFVAATYARQGKFSELKTALLFGGDENTANLCDAQSIDQCKQTFAEFQDSPIKGEYPLLPETCTTDDHGWFCGGLDEFQYGDRT